MNYYPHHIGDYARKTAHLTFAEDAAYRRMLDLYYSSERPLPGNRAGLYRLLRARSKEEQRAVDTVLLEFFQQRGEAWHNDRADDEIARWQAKADKARQSAGVRWQSGRNANALPDTSVGNANHNQEPKPEPKRENRSQGSRLASDWVLPADWEAWAMEAEGWTQAKTLEVAEGFRLHWIAKAGKDARKADWYATWQGWVRRQKEFTAKPKGNGHDHQSEPVSVPCVVCTKPISGKWISYQGGRAHDACWEAR